MRETILIALLFVSSTVPALAWGATGHKIVNAVAESSLPALMPEFLRTPAAVAEIMALGPEPDRSKGAGNPHDADADPGHYVNADDTFSVAGVVKMNALPKDREAYDAVLESAHSDEYHYGYLPYSIMDGWQQIRKDFAYWRVDNYLAQRSTSPHDRRWFANDRALREVLTLRDIGVWGHYVGDASQPLHLTIHYNGWGNYPNPKNYSMSDHLHSNFEGAYVRKFARLSAVATIVRGAATKLPYADGQAVQTQVALSQTQENAVFAQIAEYMIGGLREVVPLYALEKRDAFSAAGSAAGTDFAEQQLARGAMEMRDLIVFAWDSSLTQNVGYPLISVRDVLSGKRLPVPNAFATD